MTTRGRMTALFGAPIWSATCALPTAPGVAQGIQSIKLLAPAILLVHEMALVTIHGVDGHGQSVTVPWGMHYATQDPAVAAASDNGVVRGVGRGVAVILATSGSFSAKVSIRVSARLHNRHWRPTHRSAGMDPRAE